MLYCGKVCTVKLCATVQSFRVSDSMWSELTVADEPKSEPTTPIGT